MGYYLKAFIGKTVDLENIAKSFSSASVVKLDQGLSIVPMTEDLFDQMNNMTASGNINSFEFLTLNIETETLKCIGYNCCAYVEAEYFGGEGGQSGVIWKDGKRSVEFGYGQGIINKVLNFFGVVANKDLDEFDTLGLGRYRNTSEWVD